MPDGYTHGRISVSLAAGTLASGIVAAVFGKNLAFLRDGVVIAGGMLLGIILTPDLDLAENFWNSFRFSDLWRKFPRWLWFAFWYPYARLMAHRSTLSHFPVISTLIRIGYMLAPILFTACSLQVTPEIVWNSIPWLDIARLSGLVFIGLILSDLFHYLADMIL